MSNEVREVLTELIEALGAQGVLPADVCIGWTKRLHREGGLIARSLGALKARLDSLNEEPSPESGQVWRSPTGAKTVITQDMIDAWGEVLLGDWTYVCAQAHAETNAAGKPEPDYSYTCRGNRYCRCIQ